jgi:hypothetical protein
MLKLHGCRRVLFLFLASQKKAQQGLLASLVILTTASPANAKAARLSPCAFFVSAVLQSKLCALLRNKKKLQLSLQL